jgi:pimeloyl-ACP methyl ester carboxylesterase
MTRMLDQLESELDGIARIPAGLGLPGLAGLPDVPDVPGIPEIERGPVMLIGSSLGGTLAILAAARMPWVDRVVLLAPAVMFAKAGHHLLPPDRIETWRREGAMSFFHYGYGEQRPLSFQFYEDSLQYDPFEAQFAQPTLIFQGRRDASVDAATVERFASGRPNVTLSLLDDDHSLVTSLPRIWHDLEPFLGLR